MPRAAKSEVRSLKSEVSPPPPPAPAPTLVAPSGPVPKPDAHVASGSGPHKIPSNPAEALRAWEFVLKQLEKINVTLSGLFEPARVLAWTADKLDLGFPSQFEMSKELAEGKLDTLRRVLEEDFKHSPKISISLIEGDALAEGGARSILEATRERTTQERSKREAEAREHPITKHVLQTFGAQIKEIKTDV